MVGKPDVMTFDLLAHWHCKTSLELQQLGE